MESMLEYAAIRAAIRTAREDRKLRLSVLMAVPRGANTAAFLSPGRRKNSVRRGAR